MDFYSFIGITHFCDHLNQTSLQSSIYPHKTEEWYLLYHEVLLFLSNENTSNSHTYGQMSYNIPQNNQCLPFEFIP